ncbi:hypothetical protein FGO68_gene6303 [Halteria grandinella]|uniref:Uncharacterized protein n=1 Tax=Halteria grandinella TaxID=5974 RepID=A0A8J8T5T0_HALGN|nr:hypothetical protein FGO68_gene6303 [Halteria grandinella]
MLENLIMMLNSDSHHSQKPQKLVQYYIPSLRLSLPLRYQLQYYCGFQEEYVFSPLPQCIFNQFPCLIRSPY